LELEGRSPSDLLFRIARRPDAWTLPDWSRAHEDGTFGNRFDDSSGYYRVLYASTQRLGCFLETLARFRKPIGLDEEFAAIEGEDDFVPLGCVPVEWISERTMGAARIAGNFADFYTSRWVSFLREALADDARRLGFEDIDVAVMLRDRPRDHTQRASHLAWSLGYDGVFYRSRFGHEIENWAIFEPLSVSHQVSEELEQYDPDLRMALAIHNLVLD